MTTAPTIIGLSGYAGAGKDTVGEFLEDLGYEKAAFADRLKELTAAFDPICAYLPNNAGRWLAKLPFGYWLLEIVPTFFMRPFRLTELIEMYGAEEAKRRWPEVRRAYQKLGTEVGRAIDDDLWVKLLAARLTDGSFVITDVRFPNEAEMIHSLGGEVWRIVRPGYEAVNSHASEHALDGFDFDYVIQNDGTLQQLGDAVRERLLALQAVG